LELGEDQVAGERGELRLVEPRERFEQAQFGVVKAHLDDVVSYV